MLDFRCKCGHRPVPGSGSSSSCPSSWPALHPSPIPSSIPDVFSPELSLAVIFLRPRMCLLLLPASLLFCMQLQVLGVGDALRVSAAHFVALSLPSQVLRSLSPLAASCSRQALHCLKTGLRGKQSVTHHFVLNVNVGHCSVFRGLCSLSLIRE